MTFFEKVVRMKNIRLSNDKWNADKNGTRITTDRNRTLMTRILRNAEKSGLEIN